MEYNLDELKRDVRVALDQNPQSSALTALRDTDTLSLDEIIASKIEPSALAVLQQAPVSYLSDVSVFLSGALHVIRTAAPVCLGLYLPSDFLRLVRFQLSSWEYPVYEALFPSSPLYLRSHSRYGVCGTQERPCVFLVPGSSGLGMLEIHSASSPDDKLKNCLYVRRPVVLDGRISLPVRLYHAVVYYTSYLVCLSLNDGDYAEKMLLSYKSQFLSEK